jgi:hypothetical protein
MRVSTKELRQILQITQKQGYILSTESRGVWRRFGKYVIIPKVQMDAAVRLWRREDFDVDAFDALCVLIADNEYHKVEGGHISSTQVLESEQRPDQLRLLRQWVLEQASVTVAELSIGKLPQTTITGQRQLSRPQLYRYLCRKLMQVRIFRDTSCSLFKELKLHVQVFMNRLAGSCNDRVRKLAEEPCGADLCSFVFTTDRGIFIPEPHEPAVEGCSALHSLGHDKHSPAGHMSEGEFMLAEPMLRQDDERVRAVKTGSDDLLERALESSGGLNFQQEPDNFGFRKDDSEEVRCKVLIQARKGRKVDLYA